MPEEKDISDAPASESKTKRVLERLKSYRDLILAASALIAGISSLVKPTDTTATEKSYEWTAQQVEKLSANDVKIQQDLVGLRNYLEGYALANGRSTRSIETQSDVEPDAAEPVEESVVTTTITESPRASGSPNTWSRRSRTARSIRPPDDSNDSNDSDDSDGVEDSEPASWPVIEQHIKNLPVFKAAPEQIEAPEFEDLAEPE